MTIRWRSVAGRPGAPGVHPAPPPQPPTARPPRASQVSRDPDAFDPAETREERVDLGAGDAAHVDFRRQPGGIETPCPPPGPRPWPRTGRPGGRPARATALPCPRGPRRSGRPSAPSTPVTPMATSQTQPAPRDDGSTHSGPESGASGTRRPASKLQAEARRHDEPVAGVKDGLVARLDVAREAAAFAGLDEDRAGRGKGDTLLVGKPEGQGPGRALHRAAGPGPATPLAESDPRARGHRAPNERPRHGGSEGDHEEGHQEPGQGDASSEGGQPDPEEIGQQQRSGHQNRDADRRGQRPAGHRADLARRCELGPDEQPGHHRLGRDQERVAAAGGRPA